MKSILVHTHSRNQYICIKGWYNILSWCNSARLIQDSPLLRDQSKGEPLEREIKVTSFDLTNKHWKVKVFTHVFGEFNCQDR